MYSDYILKIKVRCMSETEKFSPPVIPEEAAAATAKEIS